MDKGEQLEGTLRVRKWGASMVICIPRELREFFGVVHRDLLAYRQVGRVVVLRRIHHGELVPLSEEETRRAAVSLET